MPTFDELNGWNKRDKVWSSMNSLFKWRFRSRRCFPAIAIVRAWAPYWVELHPGTVLRDEFWPNFPRNLVIANQESDSLPKTVPYYNWTRHRTSLTQKLICSMSSSRIPDGGRQTIWHFHSFLPRVLALWFSWVVQDETGEVSIWKWTVFILNKVSVCKAWHKSLTKGLFTCLHGVGDPGLVGLVSFVFTLWGTQNKRNLPQ